MTAAKRKRLVPANIGTMSDADYEAWFRSLDDDAREKLQRRTFKGTPEWWVQFEQKDSGVGHELMDIHGNLEDAMRQYRELISDPRTLACEVEISIGHYDVLERDNLGDRDYTTVAKFGEFTDEE